MGQESHLFLSEHLKGAALLKNGVDFLQYKDEQKMVTIIWGIGEKFEYSSVLQ